MKTIDPAFPNADPIIAEVRRAKTALAAKHNFDVMAMVRSLQDREQQEDANKAVDSTATRVTPPADPSLRSGQESRHGQAWVS